MKRYMMTLMTALMAWTAASAMDYETARERAYYLTDKMAYELNLNDQQYCDAYEINLDYLLSINTAADLADARYLAYRNNDLRHILYDWQWTAFAAVDYLFRPLWWLNGGWHFPVYNYYAHSYYFYHRPRIYWEYRGGHGRHYFAGGYYMNRRPTWHGGLRGMHRSMIGHPSPGQGRYGVPGRGIEHRGGGYRFDLNNRHNGNGYNNDRNGYNHRPEGGHSNGYRPEGGHSTDRGFNDRNSGYNSYRPEGRSSMDRGMTRGSGVSRGSSVTREPSVSRESSFSRGSSVTRGSRESSFSRGSSMSRESRGSRGADTGRSSRGGRH